jgi:predicted metal-dependent phosphoesterase TrpH
MPSNNVDLHCHSTVSDGTHAPRDVVQLACDSGLSALSLTDHDTIAGIAEALAAATNLGLDFLPGIEISCIFPKPGLMHLLGYGIDPQSESLTMMTRKLIEGRDGRNLQIIEKLQSLNVEITLKEVEEIAGGDVIARPHIAQILIKKGYSDSIKQAFDKYLAPGGLAFFDKEVFTSRQAIELIRSAGGIAVLAHPVQLKSANSAQLEQSVKNLVDLGLEGIEVIHSDHDEHVVKQITHLADKYDLLKTGGSDFHGSRKPGVQLGVANGRKIPRAWFDAIVARVKK